MIQPGRKYSAGDAYRYGFNGKENDNDVKRVEGSQQDYGMRIYDPRLGKFLSVDPLSAEYPELTPYQFASNRPIDGIDLDGLEVAKKNVVTGEIVALGPVNVTPSFVRELNANGWVIYSPNTVIQRQAPQVYKPQIQPAHSEINNEQARLRAKVAMAQPVPKPESVTNEQEIIRLDIYGNSWIGKPSSVEGNVDHLAKEYNATVGESIRFGPFGAIGYMAYPDGAKDRGAFVGNAVDGVLMSFAGIQNESNTYISRPVNPSQLKNVPNTEAQRTLSKNSSIPKGFGTFADAAKFRTTPKTLNEQFALQEAMNGGGLGSRTEIISSGGLHDPRLKGMDVSKYSYNRQILDANGKVIENIEIHYLRNNETGATFDFKFKY